MMCIANINDLVCVGGRRRKGRGDGGRGRGDGNNEKWGREVRGKRGEWEREVREEEGEGGGGRPGGKGGGNRWREGRKRSLCASTKEKNCSFSTCFT